MFPQHMPSTSYSDPDLGMMSMSNDLFYTPSSASAMSGFDPEGLDYNFGGLDAPAAHNAPDFDFGLGGGPDYAPVPVVQTPNYMHEHVMYFFENVKKIHPIFAESTVMNITHKVWFRMFSFPATIPLTGASPSHR